jgi:hypothetical protein
MCTLAGKQLGVLRSVHYKSLRGGRFAEINLDIILRTEVAGK